MGSITLRQGLTVLLLVAVLVIVLAAILYRPQISQIWYPAACTPHPSGVACDGI